MQKESYRPKVIVTKIGLDGHDRGCRLVAAQLRDSGMEVVYTPPWQSIKSVVKLAVEEDADVIGISSLATDHLLVPDLLDALKQADLEHVRVIVGGIVPADDEVELLAAGVSEIFHPGASLKLISESVHRLAQQARQDAMEKLEEVIREAT